MLFEYTGHCVWCHCHCVSILTFTFHSNNRCAYCKYHRGASIAADSCLTYELPKKLFLDSTNPVPPLLFTPPTLFVHHLYSNLKSHCSLWKQGRRLLNPLPPTPLILHIIYAFLLLFSAPGVLVFYNNIDERWHSCFCLVSFGKWHTPRLDRETQQGLAQACLPYEEILAFLTRGVHAHH